MEVLVIGCSPRSRIGGTAWGRGGTGLRSVEMACGQGRERVEGQGRERFGGGAWGMGMEGTAWGVEDGDEGGRERDG